MDRLSIAAAALLVLASGCRSSSNDDDDDEPPVLTAISVSPQDLILAVDLGAAGTQAFTAEAAYDDGSFADVTGDVVWSFSVPGIGTFDGATFESTPTLETLGSGGEVGATLDGISGGAYLTLVAYETTSDLLFILPFQDPGGIATDDATLLAKREDSIDVYFLIDATGSMGGEITNFQNAIDTTILPVIRGDIPDSRFGVGAIQDFPVDPYGDDTCAASGIADQPFTSKQVITDSLAAVQTGVNSLQIGCGVDVPESHIEALYQVMTGQGLDAPSPTSVPATNTGFRPEAAHIVIGVSDSISHAPGEGGTCSSGTISTDYGGAVAAVAHTRAQTKAALAQSCTRFVAVASTAVVATCGAEGDFTDFATTTGARIPPSAWDVPARPAGCAVMQCCTAQNGAGMAADADGLCPLVFRADGNGTGIGPTMASAVAKLTRYAASDIDVSVLGLTSSLSGVPLGGSATTADFIESIAPASFVAPMAPPTLPTPTFDANGFYGVAPDTSLTYTVSAFNDVLAESSEPRLYRVRLQITAGCTALDERDLLFLVPRSAP